VDHLDHLDHIPSSLSSSLPSILLLLLLHHSQTLCSVFLYSPAACLCIRLYSRVTSPVCPPATPPRR
jgi:hypothetical protein